MPLLERARNIIQSSTDAVETATRAEHAVLTGNMMNGFFGLFDDREITRGQLRSAYRGIVSMLIEYRAKNFAPHMLNAVVERRTGDGQEEWESVEPEHPMVRLLRRPFPGDIDEGKRGKAALKVYKWMSKIYDGMGHSDFVVKEGRLEQGGPVVPISLLPVYPIYGRMQPHLDGEGHVIQWSFHKEDGHIETFDAGDVIRIERQHPEDPRKTAGLVEAAAYEIDQYLAANIFGRDKMLDQGMPQVGLETDKTFSERSELTKLSNDFASTYRVGRRSGVPVSHGGLKIKELQLSPRDAQFQQQREFILDVLFMIFETHKGLFAENATEANAVQADRAFATRTVQPQIDEWSETLTHEFERIFRVEEPDTLRIKAPNAVPMDPEQREKVNRMRVERGVPINVIMREQGEDEVEGGDTPLVRSTLQSLDMASGGF